MSNQTLLHLIGPKESKTDLALRIYDTATPPVSVYRAAKLAGIKFQTLATRLKVREQFERARCPTCHLFPGQRKWTTKPGPTHRPISVPVPVDAPEMIPPPR